MNNIYIFFFFLFYYSNIINFCNATLNQSSNQNTTKNKNNNEFNKKNHKKIFLKKRKFQSKKSTRRKLNIEGTLDNPDGLTKVPLKILIDYEELKKSCPPRLKGYLNNIKYAMKYAQFRLENLLTIRVDADRSIDYVGEGSNTFENDFDISYSESYFDSSFHLNDSYNYFIFGKFIENVGNNIINEDTSSLILDGYSRVPCLGIIFFNKNIDESKLSLDYLEPLMLHHFIRLLGFNYQVVQKIDGKYTLNENEYSNVIEYAKKYFDCSNIQKIVLTEENEGYYYGSEEDLTALYWPKSLFDGELLTKF